MGKPLSMDLRSRTLASVDEGGRCRAAARRFGMAAATVIRWHDQRRITGGYAAKAQGRDPRSRRIEAHAPTILALHEARRDITLDELRRDLGPGGRRGGDLDAAPFLRPPRDHAQKKTGHAIEQDRADVLSQREAWCDGQLDLEPARLVFIDETWTATNMTWNHGRCRRGERLRMGYPPHGHRKTTTLVAGLRMTGMVGPMVLDGRIKGDWFEAYVGQVLVPDLKRGNIVIIDNLSSHKRASIRNPIETAAARLMFLPPHSPDFKPFEKAFARLKAMLRKAGERTVSGLWSRIGRLVDLFQPQQCANNSSFCGCDPD
ncbi:IS630 family transposase [Sphingomonas abaci]|uniref:IS630 family transposase n=1 Tax=Sphingomonas abaci TaxID=237611 RepID=UPI001FE4D6A8|nr:IS630 family transposase [Sphingomonas abaci]